MNVKCLPLNCKKVLNKITSIINGYDFILAGGTALTLQLGHRKSIDLDFFAKKLFDTGKLFEELASTGLNVQLQDESKGTLYVIINNVRLSFLYYPYPFMEDVIKWQGIALASPIDIAGMKAVAIIQRGAKRDFIDLYFVLQDIPFWKVACNMVKRYTKQRINPVSFGKAIVYFNDAETDPDPEYCSKIRPTWKETKYFFMKNVKQMVLDLQNAIEC